MSESITIYERIIARFSTLANREIMPQPTRPLDDLRLRDWTPRTMLRVPSTTIDLPQTPCIDIHNHLGRWLTHDGGWMIKDVHDLIRTMNTRHVDIIVNLDGMWGDEIDANLDRYDRAYPNRFVTFCQLDWRMLAEPDAERRLIAQLEDNARRGARGVKVWKSLGLTFHDASGALVSPDDPRVVSVLHRAGELGLPVLIHTADPRAFFEPLNAHNERLDELREAPDWWFGDLQRYPTFDDLLTAHANLVLACPQTTFIGAHVGCAAEDLDAVSALMAAAPLYHVDIAGRMAELGRQPRRFAALVERHPDRVLFGTDIYPADDQQYALHYRFLESSDEGFEYAPGAPIPPQGRWAVSGAALAPRLLPALYRDNARRVLDL